MEALGVLGLKTGSISSGFATVGGNTDTALFQVFGEHATKQLGCTNAEQGPK
jgi:hypothetical protein